MARQERSIDPNDGPLEAFAHALRKVRVEAGNPTYRSLARAAGYSASTLSQAAAGTRQPSLEVVMAYVGACDGDVADWRERWLDLYAALNGSRQEAAEETPSGAAVAADSAADEHREAASPAEPALSARTDAAVPRRPETVAPAKPPIRRQWWLRTRVLASLGAVLVVLAVPGAVLATTGHWSAPEPRANGAAAPTCAAMPESPALRAGRTAAG